MAITKDNRVLVSSIFVLSGPSGVGKTTLINQLLTKYPDLVYFPPSYTTREPRKGEKDGKDMFFVPESTFLKSLENREFIAYNKIYGNYYGTKKKDMLAGLEAHKRVIMALDEKGADDIRDSGFRAVYVYLAPAELSILRSRLSKRKLKTWELNERLSTVEREMEARWKYDYLLLSGTNNESFVFDQMIQIMGFVK